jgi:hypothetical protein
MNTTNSQIVIAPYWWQGTWVFDDERYGLEREPFVKGAPEIITRLVERAGLDPEIARRDGIRLLFSAQAFPGCQEEASRIRPELGGWWYRTVEPALEGWLCPELFNYFTEAPDRLYVKAEAQRPGSVLGSAEPVEASDA